VEVEEGLWDLVARGLVTADGFQAVRSLWSARDVWRRRRRDARSRLGSRRSAGWRDGGDGRWALLRRDEDDEDADDLAEHVAAQLLARWGVVFWDLSSRETLSVPWREVRWALRRLEARGLVRGGRFVSGFTGEQYALPEAVDELRRIRRAQPRDEIVRLSAADPLNLVGIVLPGDRVPAVRTRRIAYRDGMPFEEPVHGLVDGRRAVGG
jgi:ATP-dependent Lhr-like helicase